MPTPHLSRATSGPSSGYAVGDEICDTSCPIDWDTNVVNFISTCLHPGLVRRTSSSATYGFDKPHHFVRQHRRNLSTATTVGFSRHLDNHISSSRVPYSNVPNHPNDNQAPSLYYSRRVLGHARNISDPTSGWDFRIVTKPLILDQLTERPSYNWDGSVEQNPVVSGEHYKIPDVLFIPEAKNETYPCIAPHPPCDITLEKSLVCPSDSEAHEITAAVNDDDSSCLCPCLQTCANPYVVLMGLCLTMFMQTMVVSGLMSSMFTTLERRFNLSSRQIGYMISCYEVAGVVTTVIVSFISGQKHNRLRVIGLATLILALGFGLFALPHFLAGPYRPNLSTVTSGNNGSRISTEDILLDSSPRSSTFSLNQDLENSIQLDGPLCIDQSHNTVFQNAIPTSLSDQTNVDGAVIRAASLTTTDNSDINEPSSTGFIERNDIVQSVLFPTFCVAMLLAGIGASPLYVLAPTYLWDNLTDRQYPIYAALFYSAGGLGPACGFLAGAGFLSVYIDSPFMLPEIGLDRNSPLWLGAWWLGILVCAALTFLVALPVICLPKRLIINKNDSNTISNETAGDCNEITSPATIHHNSHNISYPTNLNNNNVNLSYVTSSDNLSNMNIKQTEQLQSPLKSTVVASAAVSSVAKTQMANETIDPSPGSHKIQYPSLKEFKQQQQIPEIKEYNVDLHKTPSVCSSTSITSHRNSPHSRDDDNRSTIIPLNNHFHSHLDTTDLNNSVELNADEQTTNNLGKSLKTSFHNSFCESKNNLKSKIKASYLILRRVLTNPIWLGVTVSTVVEQSIVSAFLTFAAKYIQILFHIPAYLASIHTGAVIVPSSLLGVLSGALLMRHFRPTLHRTLSGLCIMIALTVVTSISLIGWPWKNGPGFLIPPNLTAPCNQYCYSSMDRLKKVGSRHTQYSESQCSVRHYNPVCWTGIINKETKDNKSVICATAVANGDNLDNFSDKGCNIESLTFFNPCFAGCRTRVLEAGVIKKYSDCQCVTPYSLNPSGSISSLASSSPASPSLIRTTSNDELLLMTNPGEVYPGRCKPKCALYGLFLAMLFLHILCTGMLQNPSNVITLSCVSSEDGSVALGLQIFFVRTLDEHSAASGGCLEYNLEGLPFIWLGTVCALKVISLIGSTVTWWLAKRQFDLIAKHKAKHQQQQQQQSQHDQEDKKLEVNTALPSNTPFDPVNSINNNSSQFNETTLSQPNCQMISDCIQKNHQIPV
ncbi:Solute carrier organic anion transporter family member 4A1 [Schistosoma japonicum]|nr:Solute carrier organic anion transporter family member 4A1 [Schistosoma japonicum]KAH8856613.1 Solute carrier organic anion transporter family member 4A1 [Schistosoma japonicum]KAH8856614.1 Solute carrier organic anion transporter family member 4A1 [Schistosoma japonicum]